MCDYYRRHPEGHLTAEMVARVICGFAPPEKRVALFRRLCPWTGRGPLGPDEEAVEIEDMAMVERTRAGFAAWQESLVEDG